MVPVGGACACTRLPRCGPRLTAGSPSDLGVGSTLSGRMGMLGRGLGTGSTLPPAGTRGGSLEGPPPCPADAAATHIAAAIVQGALLQAGAALFWHRNIQQ